MLYSQINMLQLLRNKKNYHCYLHPLKAAKLCRNSRLVVDKDDLKWVAKKIYSYYLNGPVNIFVLKSLGVRNLGILQRCKIVDLEGLLRLFIARTTARRP